MKRALLAVAVGLSLCNSAVAAALTLFDVDLLNATPASLHRAAVSAGARLLTVSGGHRVYDARKLGLPGAVHLETLFDGERFVIATYSFDGRHAVDHQLRRLLVAKYGPAHVLISGQRHEIKLDEPYAEAPGARWDVDAPMELVYDNVIPSRRLHVFTDTRLTYVNRPLFDALEQRVAEEGRRADQAKVRAIGKAF